ncbi:MAG TPA: hypothetical protein VGM93_11595 [Acidimicrobiales bacterium]
MALVALTLMVGSHGRYTEDEGAAATTARSLVAGHGWLTPDPVPAADPTGTNYPLVQSDWGTKGTSAYAKHPTYAGLLAVADRAAGVSGMVGLSVAGTALAALASALLARRIDPRLAAPTLWLVGLGSPLLFDSQLLVAHAVAAATAGFAVLAFDAARDAPRRPAAVLGVIGAVLTLATALLRTEGVLLAVGLGLALAVTVPMERRLRGVLLGGAAVVAGGAAFLADHLARVRIVGAAIVDPSPPTATSQGLLADRLHAFVHTMLTSGFASGTGPILVLAVSVLLGTAVFALRRGGSPAKAGLLALGAGLLAVVRAFLPNDAIPGLLVAWPALWVGLVLAGRSAWGDSRRRLLVGASALFALAVFATQYAAGGGLEWGGRYFALALPLLAPVAVAGLDRAGAAMGGRDRRRAVAGLVLVSVGLSVVGLRELRSTESATNRFVDRVAETAGPVGAAEGRPVIVTTASFLPRVAWSTFDRQRWLLVDPDHPQDLVARLRRAGVGRFTFVTPDPTGEARVVHGARAVHTVHVDGWALEVLHT